MTALMEPEAGVQRPRIMHVPVFGGTAGQEAVELAASAGLILDPWQRFVLEQSLGEAPDGTWSATEVGLVVPRQNGKDAVLEARELAALFLFGEELIIHSAHHFKTAEEHFNRLISLIEGSDDLRRRIRKPRRSHGQEAIELVDGSSRIKFFTRTKGGGRGFSAPLVIFNEAMMLPEAALGALLPTQATFPNRQRWFAGSAVDQFIHEDGVVLARLRERGMAGEDPRLAYFEWSVDADTPDDLGDRRLCDPDEWTGANPGLGVRISREAVEDELAALDRRTFAVERLGVGDWPPTSAEAQTVFDLDAWDALTAAFQSDGLLPALAFDVSPDRAWSSIAAGFRGTDGRAHVEVVEHKRGTGWVARRIAELRARHEPIVVMCAGSSPAESLVFQLNELGVDVEVVQPGDHAKACGHLADLVEARALGHLGSAELRDALAGAARKPYGDSWLWSRRASTSVISPLVAATLAVWGQATLGWDPAAEVTIW